MDFIRPMLPPFFTTDFLKAVRLVARSDSPRRALKSQAFARKPIPILDFAIGTAIFACGAALVLGFIGRSRASLIIFCGMLTAMALLLISAQLLRASSSTLVKAGYVSIWGIALLFVGFLSSAAVSIGFKRPAVLASLTWL
jgi:hypothetical protein